MGRAGQREKAELIRSVVQSMWAETFTERARPPPDLSPDPRGRRDWRDRMAAAFGVLSLTFVGVWTLVECLGR